MHVSTTSSKDHRELTEYLDKQEIQYYVVPSRAENPIKTIIKGLPPYTTTDEIKEGLIAKGFKVAKVNQLRRFKDKKPHPIFQVHLLKSENVKGIYNLDSRTTSLLKLKSTNVKQ
ncbi:hypothetical protein AVEN_54597-1 [Araneus ventricosus]|uniref:Pre-C2HC domain-containing protein n=1 Tax=Araneus ventricosus TaxID=182803 RepID=A0A4Y2BND5_ARAVE|nr:hypothetical protein AVEN_54597-1 [Araneus ventricosus]